MVILLVKPKIRPLNPRIAIEMNVDLKRPILSTSLPINNNKIKATMPIVANMLPVIVFLLIMVKIINGHSIPLIPQLIPKAILLIK